MKNSPFWLQWWIYFTKWDESQFAIRPRFPGLYSILPATERAEFDQNKARATAVPNSIDRIKFDFSTAVVRRLKPSRATAV